MLLIGGIVMIDTFTGIMAAKKKKQKITSAGLARFINKTGRYIGTIIFVFLTEKYLLGDLLTLLPINFEGVHYPLSKIVTLAVMYVESFSISENWEVLYGYRPIDKIKEMFKDIFKLKKDLEG